MYSIFFNIVIIRLSFYISSFSIEKYECLFILSKFIHFFRFSWLLKGSSIIKHLVKGVLDVTRV